MGGGITSGTVLSLKYIYEFLNIIVLTCSLLTR